MIAAADGSNNIGERWERWPRAAGRCLGGSEGGRAWTPGGDTPGPGGPSTR